MKGQFLIHNRVRVARVERGMTQEQLANAVGVTRQTIGLIEIGRYNPTLSLAFGIAHALGMGIEKLFWIEEVDHAPDSLG